MDARIMVTNATLKRLVWRPSYSYRSLIPRHGDKLIEDRARASYRRAAIKGVKAESGKLYYEGCLDRYNRDSDFRDCMNEQKLDHHDMDYYDRLAKLPKGPHKPVPRDERIRR